MQPLWRCGDALLAPAVTVVEQAGGQEDACGGEDDDADRQHRSEVADHRHAGDVERQKAYGRCDDGDAERRPEVGQRISEAGKRAAAALGLLFEPAVHLDREVHAQPDEDRQAGDGDHGQRDAEVADQPERPNAADQHNAERQQPPARAKEEEEDDHHDCGGQHRHNRDALPHCVVDLLQQDRRPGRQDIDAGEVVIVYCIDGGGGGIALLVDRHIAIETHDHQRMLRVREDAGEIRPDCASLVEDKEVNELRIVQRLLPRRHQPPGVRSDASAIRFRRRVARVLGGILLLCLRCAARSGFRPRSLCGGVLQAGNRARRQLCRDRDLVLRKPEDGERAEDGVVEPALLQLVLERGELANVRRRKELADVACREKHQHRLPSELLLVADVVSEYLGAGRDECILACLEL